MRGSSGVAFGADFKLEQGHAAGAKPRRFAVALDKLQPDRLTVEVREAGEVARLQSDRSDAQRRAVGVGDLRGGVGGVHGGGLSLCRLYRAPAPPNNRR